MDLLESPTLPRIEGVQFHFPSKHYNNRPKEESKLATKRKKQ